MKETYDLVVLGSGPGGYTAAFRAADLGLSVALVERYEAIGGVCLNVGCIPSKTLLHFSKVLEEVSAIQSHGIQFSEPRLDLKKIAAYKDKVISNLTSGLKMLAKQRKVDVIRGEGQFLDSNTLTISGKTDVTLNFKQAVIAAGSEPMYLPFMPEDPRIMNSTDALQLKDVTGEMLVIGGGIIGLEMATVYDAFGARISVVECMDQLMPGVDPNLVKPYLKRVKSRYQSILLNTKVTAVKAKPEGLYVHFEGPSAPTNLLRYDRILVSVGRKPNGHTIGAELAGVQVDERGFIAVDKQMRTNVSHIFAIGDIVGQPMLAHKAIPEGKVAAEVAAGKKHYFDVKCIPNVAYTDPEIAWVGLTEIEAKKIGVSYEVGQFPWAASGRALSMGRTEGLTKLLYDAKTHQILGAGIIGVNAGELISEVALAIEMGCEASDLALTIHPHPTLSETVAQATEAFEGSITDLYLPKKKNSHA